MVKKRADILLTEKRLAASREQARRMIEEGLVFSAGRPVSKASTLLDKEAPLEILPTSEYVSRGGKKLEAALEFFNIDVRHKIALDVGSSSGGFTEQLLKHGADEVTAVDVGYGQLAWTLRQDPRVRVFEKTNIRHFDYDRAQRKFDLITVDVSFISTLKISANLLELLAEDGELLLLVKPQFEAGPELVGKKGVVREQTVHRMVLENVIAHYEARNCHLKGVTYSPLRGPRGNIEFFAYFSRKPEDRIANDVAGYVHKVVAEAHGRL